MWYMSNNSAKMSNIQEKMQQGETSDTSFTSTMTLAKNGAIKCSSTIHLASITASNS